MKRHTNILPVPDPLTPILGNVTAKCANITPNAAIPLNVSIQTSLFKSFIPYVS